MFFHRLRASSSKIRGFSSRNFSQIEIILCVLKKRVSTNIISDFRDIEPTKKGRASPCGSTHQAHLANIWFHIRIYDMAI
jgi:hypothetical protein